MFAGGMRFYVVDLTEGSQPIRSAKGPLREIHHENLSLHRLRRL